MKNIDKAGDIVQSIKRMLTAYLENTTDTAKRKDAREASFYFIVESLLNSYSKSCGKENMCITTLHKETEAGIQFFRAFLDSRSPITVEDKFHGNDIFTQYSGLIQP